MPKNDVIAQTNPFIDLMDHVGIYLRPYNHIVTVSADQLERCEGAIICGEIIEAVDESIKGIKNVVIVIEDTSERFLNIFLEQVERVDSEIPQDVQIFHHIDSGAFGKFLAYPTQETEPEPVEIDSEDFDWSSRKV